MLFLAKNHYLDYFNPLIRRFISVKYIWTFAEQCDIMQTGNFFPKY